MPYESVQMDSANSVSNTVSGVPSKKQGEAHPINQQATVSQLDSRFQVSSNGFSTSRIRSSSGVGGKNDVKMPQMQGKFTDSELLLADNVCKALNKNGVCCLTDYLEFDYAEQIYQQVREMYKGSDLFKSGVTIPEKGSGGDNDLPKRGDKIAWLGPDYRRCPGIKVLCDRLDRLMSMLKLEKNISSRTRTMVACYPANDTSYVKHVDNPHKDGRFITAIFYINKNWDKKRDGGVFRVTCGMRNNQTLDLEPLFNKLLLFYSDKRNPHEVTPCKRERFAITHWYFDDEERKNFINGNT